MRATLKDVAALAGTSTATASRVISGRGFVAPATRARILAAMKTLHYSPNLRARGLRKRSSGNVSLVIPNLLNAYYTALADAIVGLLNRQHLHLLLASTEDDADSERETIYDMVGQDVDGLIWVPSSPGQELLAYLQAQHIPTVSIVRRVPGDVFDTVVFEDFNGSYAATSHLIDLGHERIGYIGGDVRHSSNHARWQGYLAALREHGLPVDESLVKLGVPRSTWGSMAATDLLRQRQPVSALFVASNGLMSGVVKTLRQQRVAVPGNLSLICFDDIDWFSFSVPPITAISVSHTRLAEAAVDLLLRRVEARSDDGARPAFMEINYELLVRGSTAPARRQASPGQGKPHTVPMEPNHA